MNAKIKLDIISDVVCPWCIVGYKHLEKAINELQLQDSVDIEWQPFELNPDMPAQGEHLREHVARKYGASKDDSDRAREQITAHGADFGFEFNYFDDMKMVNTFDAHVILDYAHSVGQQTEYKLRLFAAFFTEEKDVSKHDILLAEAQRIGLDKHEVEQALRDNSRREHVKSLESQWQQLGISGVPTVLFNRRGMLTGAQSVDAYKRVLLELSAPASDDD